MRRKIKIKARSVPRMGDDSAEAFFKRISLRQERIGIPSRQIGLQAGYSSDFIRTSIRQRGMSAEAVARIALILRTAPEWLLRGEGPEEVAPPADIKAAIEAISAHAMPPPLPPISKPLGRPKHGFRRQGVSLIRGVPAITGTLNLRGVVASDAWIDESAATASSQTTHLAPDPRHPVEQFAVELRDASLDHLGAQPGDLLQIAKLLPPRSGDLVLFTRNRSGLIQHGVRRLFRPGSGTELRSESTDSRFAEPINIHDESHMEEELGITFDGVVIGLYRPLS